MSAPAGKPAPKLSRRRFVALTGAGLAALSAGGAALGASAPAKSGATKSKKPAAAAATPAPQPPPPSAQQKEFERQKTGTLSALKTIRAWPLPPGGDLPVVFKPMREPKKGH